MDITEKFKNLNEHKQKRILNAALQEFAENGYEQASTNKIVKNAEIGKGMLFHYFNNKKELYHYLIDYAINIMLHEYFRLIDTNESDFIERLRQIAQIKINYHNNNPNVSNFISTVFLDDEVELPATLQTRLNDLQRTGNALLYKNIDKSLFRNDVDVDKVFQLIRWSIEGYQNQLIKQFKGQKITQIDLDPYWDEYYEYLDVLKTSFYKKEEGKR